VKEKLSNSEKRCAERDQKIRELEQELARVQAEREKDARTMDVCFEFFPKRKKKKEKRKKKKIYQKRGRQEQLEEEKEK